jgi:hypothetical protein
VRFAHLLAAATIQVIVLFIPLVAGIADVISGGAAGFTAVVGWFLVGIPLSYAAIDRLTGRHGTPQNLRDTLTPRRLPSTNGPTATDFAPAAR